MKKRTHRIRPVDGEFLPEADAVDFPPEADDDAFPPDLEWDDGPEPDDDGFDVPAADAEASPPVATDAVRRAEPVAVTPEDDGLRLDRWFRRHFPHVGHGPLERWLRTGQVRLDGRRARASDRVQPGQQVRVPPAAQAPSGNRQRPAGRPPTPEETAELLARVLYRDDRVLVIDKPAGLAVQGGTRTARHLDGLLDALAFDGERPRLVHRLDRDTSGVLVLARTAAAAAALAAAFAARKVQKLYWAVVVGVPQAPSGRIAQALGKRFGAAGERVGADEDGLPAVTFYRVIERAGSSAAWLGLVPRTGRTHQLRAHCTLLGTPILGDGKYGGASAFLAEAGDATRLHLHARAVRFPHPAGGEVTVEAPLPAHMRETFEFFGFDESAARGAPPEWDEARELTRQVGHKATPRPSARTDERRPAAPKVRRTGQPQRPGPGSARPAPRRPRG